MSITDELRAYAKDYELYINHHQLLEIADRIDVEHQKECDAAWDNGYEADYGGIENWLIEHPQVMEWHGLTRLPKDANGIPVRIGDVMEWPDHFTADVIGIGYNTFFYVEDGADTAQWAFANNKTHHKEPTVEDLLREFADKIIDSQIPNIHPTYEETITEYTAKLRLADDEKEW